MDITSVGCTWALVLGMFPRFFLISLQYSKQNGGRVLNGQTRTQNLSLWSVNNVPFGAWEQRPGTGTYSKQSLTEPILNKCFIFHMLVQTYFNRVVTKQAKWDIFQSPMLRWDQQRQH